MYDVAKTDLAGDCAIQKPTLKEQIKERLSNSQQKVAELQELEKLLENNPEFERMMTLMQKGIY